MAHCREAQAFLHCSSTGVYEAAGGSPQRETDPLGDNHRVMMPTYSISKIAAEAVVRTTCRLFEVPTTIARLNVPYGDGGGWPAFHLALMLAGRPVPVHPDGPSRFNPIHEDDIVATLPAMLEAASVPATIVNWGGDEETSIEAWCEYMGELVGVAMMTRALVSGPLVVFAFGALLSRRIAVEERALASAQPAILPDVNRRDR